MTPSTCGAEAVLRPGGPVRIPLQPCCLAVLLRAAGLRCPFLEDLPEPVLAAAAVAEGSAR